MDYNQTVDYLFNQLPVYQVIGPGAYKPGLDNAYTLSRAFGNPHEGLKTIHIAGTNGKGSTSHMIASILQEAGYKVGLYTSPHIFDFRERIRINGQPIDADYIVDFVARYQKLELDCHPSFFELTTILAFDYFRSQNVDICVIETGLGGRLDTTNIIKPMVSIVTNVSLDHTALLGNTVEEIAYEKAGIIKPDTPVVIGEATQKTRPVYEKIAKSQNAPLVFAEDNNLYLNASIPYVCDLKGTFQTHNINTVLNAFDVLGIVDDETIRRGLVNVTRNTHLIGRWTAAEYRGRNLILDTGHNIGAWQYIGKMLNDLAKKNDLWVILGFSNDKDVNSIFDMLPTEAHYCFVTPSVKRGRPSAELLKMAKDRGLLAESFDSVKEGLEYVYLNTSDESIIFVGGSNFVVADLPSEELNYK